MFGTTVGGSFSKNDLENSSSREELSHLIDDKEALKDFQKMGDANAID